MNPSAPHFLLFSESNRTSDRGQWRFVLQSLDGQDQLEAADTESDVHGERLELLAVVRGLEALPQPSRVTLVTPSRYVNRGLSYGLAEWRSNDWQWERFGEMAPIKNRDLWQRIDQAMEFHAVDCRLLRFDAGEAGLGQELGKLAGPHFLRNKPQVEAPVAAEMPGLPAPGQPSRGSNAVTARGRVRTFRRLWLQWMRRMERRWENIWLNLSRLGTRLLPPPWMG